MSFIYENNLDLLLASLGAKSLIKKAQNQGVVDPKVRYQVAFYLANDLKSQLESPVSREDSATENVTVNKPQATIANMDSLDTFAKWLADNKITWNNARIAWGIGQDRPGDALEVSVTDTMNQNAKHEPEVWVSKKDLLAYLVYLRDNAAVNNKTLQLKLNGIISDVNTHLMESNEQKLSNKPTTPTGPGGTTNVNKQYLDTVIKRIFADLPLNQKDIDMSRIGRFFVSYNSVVSENYKGQFETKKNMVSTLMQQVATFTSTGNTTNFPLYNLTSSKALSWAHGPNQTQNAGEILRGLIQIITYTNDALQLFSNNYKDKYPQLEPQLESQFEIADNQIRLLQQIEQDRINTIRAQQK